MATLRGLNCLCGCFLLTFISALVGFTSSEYTSFNSRAQCGVQLLQRKSGVSNPSIEWRVGGGIAVERHQWPWAATIMDFDKINGTWRSRCGASLISRRYVLTAAHCVEKLRRDTSRIRVRFGSNRLYLKYPEQFDVAVQNIVVHPNYVNFLSTTGSGNNDIALVRLRHNLVISGYVNTICLPPPFAAIDVGINVTLVGLGVTLSNSLPDVMQQVEVPVISYPNCKQLWSSMVSYSMERQFCTAVVNKRDSCKGDSGGPVMLYRDGHWLQVGIVSAGSNECGSDRFPSIHVDVAQYVTWITSTIK